ncbi:hypothetical protein DAEQUDRAFT_719822 [Daedalea quercina L-15889]|uniref:MARVEL domain-containing protein n=1 Tax=Daedalea quercina L-15889 TaxID=1314783 RepID=A0A165UAV9_9APHY|nr:hypothetical protein DAEQUDRAFT_719822 [Daedalea quercina L-15889]
MRRPRVLEAAYRTYHACARGIQPHLSRSIAATMVLDSTNMPPIPPVYPPPSATKLRRGRRLLPRGSSHPYLFTVMMLTAMTELGLTAFLVSAGSHSYTWASPGYYSLLILVCFMAAWTVLFAGAYVLWALDGGVHLLANVASSVIWLLLTSVLWVSRAPVNRNEHSD